MIGLPMKLPHFTALLLIAASSGALIATPATDRRIEAAAEASYNYRTVLENKIKVTAADGVVTLRGSVQDDDEKSLAADTVENLPGVTSVRNEIEIKPTHPENSDAWIALKIRSRLLMKANVSATSTTVDVKNGVVMLSGTADNIAQKELTEVYAKEIEGVKSVKNDITLTAPPANRPMGDKIDDASITSQVKFALLKNRATSALQTKVTTTDGVIVITGEAASEAEKSLVTKLAQDVRGAKSVTNSMTIRG